MKIIGFEEHYMLPAIAEANPNSPHKVFDVVRNGGGWPGLKFSKFIDVKAAQRLSIQELP